MNKQPKTIFHAEGFFHLALLMIASGCCVSDSAAAAALSIGNRRQLFVDDWIVQSTSHIERQMGTVVKNPANPILIRDKAWDAGRCDIYGSGVYDPVNDRLQIFYSAMVGDVSAGTLQIRLAYAESQDLGSSWAKPNLGLVTFDGNQQNNLLLNSASGYFMGPCVLRVVHETDAAKRYKMFASEYYAGVPYTEINGFLRANPVPPPAGIGEPGMYVAYSPDGIHWTRPGTGRFSNLISDTTQSVFWDARLGKYVAYVRARVNGLRSVGRMESADFATWTEPVIVFQGTSWSRQIYSMGVTPYQGAYIGMPWTFNGDATGDQPVMWPELAVSRDGISWSRPFEGQAFVPTGPPGSADSLQIRMSSSIIEMDDRIVLIYGQTNRPHISDMRVEVGMATMRLDGFAAMKAGDQPGGVYTKPFLLEGNELFINAVTDEAKDGWIRVGVFDENGIPLPGFTNQLCVPIEGDGIKLPVRWEQGSSLAALRGKPIRLLFQLQNASLYSFWFNMPGDADGNGRVNEVDAALLARHWLQSHVGWSGGDFNGDGLADDVDATIMAANWHVGVAARASLPEPHIAALIISAGLASLTRALLVQK